MVTIDNLSLDLSFRRIYIDVTIANLWIRFKEKVRSLP